MKNLTKKDVETGFQLFMFGLLLGSSIAFFQYIATQHQAVKDGIKTIVTEDITILGK